MKPTNQTLRTVLLAFISGIAGTLTLYYFLPTKDRVLVEYEQAMPNRFANLYLDSPQKLDFVEASEASTPAVVFIKTASTVYNQMSWFDYYFNGGGGTQQQVSSGSGVIFTKNGFIVTNNHVIDKAEKLK